MGRVINRGAVEGKVQQMNSNLEKMTTAVEQSRKSLEAVCNSNLKGVAWGTYKDYIQNVQMPLHDAFDAWIESMSAANTSYGSAASALSANILDEDEINDQIRNLQSQIDHQNNTYWLFRNYSVIVFCEIAIRLLNSKLLEIEQFAGCTSTLFTEPNSLLKLLECVKSKCDKVTIGQDGKCSYGEIDANWKEEIDRIALEKLLKDKGITEQEVDKWVAEKIYTKEEILVNLRKCESEGDVAFYDNLLSGDYEVAFAMDPNLLTDSSTIMMADYANRLYCLDRTKEFLKYNNEILRSSKMYEEIYPDGTVGETELVYRDIYLDRMYVGAKAIQESSLLIVATTDPSASNYEAMEKLYYNQWSMTNFWAAENSYVTNLRTLGPENSIGTQLKTIEWIQEEHSSKFTINHYSVVAGGYIDENVEISLLETRNALDGACFSEKMNALNKEAAELANNILADAIASESIAIASMAMPLAEAPLSMIQAALNQSPGSISGIGALGQTENQEMALSLGMGVAQPFLDYLIESENLENEIEYEKNKQKMEWFGSGGTYGYTDYLKDKQGSVINVGIYNPDVVRAMFQWKNEGLTSFAGLTDKQIDSIRGDIREKIKDPDTATEDKKALYLSLEILNNNYNPLDGTYIKMNPDAEPTTVGFDVFQNAVNQIDEFGGTDIKKAFEDCITEGSLK